jgi:hypothetical protein
VEHPAALDQHGTSHSNSSHIKLTRANHEVQRTGAKHLGLMSHRFYSMIGFSRAAQIQKANENVV